LTINETYFFREDFQLKTFTQEILPEIRSRKEKQGDRKLRIWSAGCSAGEEPYTIAMLILDIPFFHDWQIDIIGTDINQRVLQTARKGLYGTFFFALPILSTSAVFSASQMENIALSTG
jgi:chemotaxis protein methyltransferase CheR